MPAAISAPNTTSSRIRVIGTDVSSAMWKSEASRAFAAASVLAPPASATIRSGWAACTLATAAWSAATVASASACGPATLNVTSALPPPAETRPAALPPAPLAGPPGGSPAVFELTSAGPGELMSSAAPGRARSAAATCRAACCICGSVGKGEPRAAGPRGWMRTLSAGGVTTSSWCRICSARPAWPGSYCGRLWVPSSWPARNAAPTRPHQPSTAVFLCRALQQAIRWTNGVRAGRPGRAAARRRAAMLVSRGGI